VSKSTNSPTYGGLDRI